MATSGQVGEAFIRIRPDASGFARELQREADPAVRRVEQSLNRTNREFTRFGRGALVGAGALGAMGRAAAFASTSFIGGAGIVFALRSASQAASNLAEQTSRSQIVFGEFSQRVERFSEAAATATGLARDQALEAASGFGALLRPLGLTQAAASQTSTELVQLAADLASFGNTTVPDALLAIRSGLVGEIEPLRRYGIILSETAVAQEALRTTGKDSAEQLTAQEKVAARLALVFRQSTLAQGDFARTSEGLANQQRILQANLRNLTITLGNVLNPEIARVVRSLNDWLSNTENQRQVQEQFRQVVNDSVAVVEGLARGFEAIHRITRPLIGAVGGLTHAIELLIVAMAVRRVQAFSTALTGLGTAAGGAGGAGAAGAAGGAAGKVSGLQRAIGLLGNANVVAFAASAALIEGLQAQAEAASKAEENVTKLWKSWLIFAGLTPRLDRELTRLEDLRRGRVTDQEGPLAITGPIISTAIPSPQLGVVQRLRNALAAALGTPGTEDDVRALRDLREQRQRALEFAQLQLDLGRGDTAFFGQQVEAITNEITSINEQIASVAEANAAAAEAANDRATDAITRLLETTSLGFGGAGVRVVDGVVVSAAQTRAAAAAREALLGLPKAERLGVTEDIIPGLTEEQNLQLQIAEARAETEEDLLPPLRRALAAVTHQLQIIRLFGGTRKQILEATLAQSELQKRIRDIREQDQAEERVDIFAEAAEEFRRFGSNIGGLLSPADARGLVAGEILARQPVGGGAVAAAAGAAAKGALAGATIVQNFFGAKEPAQALQSASQAARALR